MPVRYFVVMRFMLAAPVLFGASIHTARVHASSPLQAVVVSHGVRLVLVVPHRVYTRGALARVTVRLENLSEATGLQAFRCGMLNPFVEVSDAVGQVRYPPPFRSPPIDYAHLTCRTGAPPPYLQLPRRLRAKCTFLCGRRDSGPEPPS